MSLLGGLGGAGGTGGGGGGMDIWSTGAFSFESPLKDLLDAGDYTLEQLLAEDELLQELRGLHPVLVQYFSTERNLTKLLLYVTLPPTATTASTASTVSTAVLPAGPSNKEQQVNLEKPVNGNREPSSSVKTETMTNDDGGVEAVASSSSPLSASSSSLEPGQWLLAQLEKKMTIVDSSSGNMIDGTDDDAANKNKHPEQDPEMLHVRFPFMACEIICCELESVIETLVQGHAVLDDNTDSTTHNAANEPTTTAASLLPPPPPAAAAVPLQNIVSTAQAAGIGSEGVEVLPGGNGNDNISDFSPPTSPRAPEDEQGQDEKEKSQSLSSSQQQQQPVRLLDLLFAVLYDTPAGQLDDYRAGYFDKILTVLFRKRPLVLRQYINAGGRYGKMAMMQAMMRHLYSQSIMQIAQRLLLPPRPVGNNNNNANASPSDVGDENGENAGGAPPDATTGSGGTGEDGGGQDILTGEDDDDDDDEDDDDHGAGGIKCDWSKSTEALDLLLERLLHPSVDLDTTVSSSPSSPTSPTSTSSSSSPPLDLDLLEEQQLAMSLNASEVLITIIQNSLLSSETMLRLTSVETLQRLTEASTTVTATYRKKNATTGGVDDDDTEQEYFSPHESLLTSAMNVIESLILQLGGYGAVGTMAILTPEEELAAASAAAAACTEAAAEVEEGVAATMPAAPAARNADSASPSSPGAEAADGVDAEGAPLLIADLTNLLATLPEMLDGFARLLRHPSTESWTSCMQFSKAQPVQLLGTSRLRIVRVLESLVLLGDPSVDSVLVQSDCLKTCLELFWEFPWCSMLHQSVANLLVHVFEGQNVRYEIQEYFLQECNLMGRLMDSFVETIDNGAGASIPATAPPSAADDDDGAAQPKPRAAKSRGKEGDNDIGGGDSGRSKKGMSSVVMDLEKAVSNANATSAMAKAALAALMTPDAAAALRAAEEEEEEAAAAADRLPVSEDDVDAALEQQLEAAAAAAREEDVEMASTEAVQQESHDGMSASLVGTPAQSFRLGYMGHVIIICQALVQACSNDWASVAGGTDQGNDEMTQQSGDVGEVHKMKSTSSGASQNSSSVGEMTDETGDLEPLLIAELVNNHTHTERWQEFVATTLSSEIAIQSTPLGGITGGGSVTGGLMTDLLSQRFGGGGADSGSGGRRPGLADDDGDMMGGDGGSAPPPPPRGIYGGGDIIDMDDNDLEVAANMMAGLGLGARPAHGKKPGSKKSSSLAGIRGGGGGGDDDGNSGEFSGSGDSEKSYNSGETASEKGYLFDDPLGKAGGLGIELGKLTQYKRGTDAGEGAAEKDKNDDGISSSSSSQEAPRDEDDKDELDSDDDEEHDVPVMDLFAGNFHHGGHESPGDGKPDDGKDVGAFDFANFASAFESGDTGGVSSFNDSTGALMDGSGGGDDSEASAKSAEIEAIFGEGDHSGLLEADDLPEDPNLTTAPTDESLEKNEEGLEEEIPETARPSTDPGRNTESSEEVVAKEEPSPPPQQEEESGKEDAWTMQTSFDIPDILTAPSDELKADSKPFPTMPVGEEVTQVVDSSTSGENQATADEVKPTEAPGDKPAAVELDTSVEQP